MRTIDVYYFNLNEYDEYVKLEIAFYLAKLLMDQKILKQTMKDLGLCLPQHLMDEYCRRHERAYGRLFLQRLFNSEVVLS